jgi:PadR family transcriptional regulator AphA
MPRVREHLRRQVHTQSRPIRRRSGREQGGLTGTASDVEHAIAVVDCRRGEQPPVVRDRRSVEVVGVCGPVGALVAVPGRNCSVFDSSTCSASVAATVLGLLAVKPWTTHELVLQVDRSMRRIWPRAQSKLYEEPKKLVAHGFARATDDSVGRRRRTRYTITAKGRRALAAWLQQPGDGPVLEFEQLLKISFSDSGTKADILANLDAARTWVLDQNDENLATGRAYLEGRGLFPQRAALNQLEGRFLAEFYVTVARWVEWASEIVKDWPDDVLDAAFNRVAAEESVQLAESITAILEPQTHSSNA